MSNQNIELSDLSGALGMQASSLKTLAILLGTSETGGTFGEGLATLLEPVYSELMRISARLEQLSEVEQEEKEV